MNKEQQFLEKLGLLKEKALGQNSRISQEEVQDFFAQDALTEEQMLLVYDYLMSQRITVTGYVKGEELVQGAKAEEEEAGFYALDEEEYLKEYQTDLEAIRKEQPGEKAALLKAVAEGDTEARSRLTEIYLPVVLEIAMQMRTSEMFLGDLVQEGNVSLMLALEFLKAEGVLEDSELELDMRLRREIRQGIQTMIEEQTEMKRCDKKMEQQVNDLDDALHRLAEDKGRAVTIEELAEYMEISEEGILDIMKLAGEDLYDKYKEASEEN